ncbi:hypothetical protein [Roseibium album]|uniref:hypothetical protein n=1 Tax=Roseibium album TaxID=311410 RepID=UPI0032974B05
MGLSDMSTLDSVIKRSEEKRNGRRGEHYLSIAQGSDFINPGITQRFGKKVFLYRVFTEDAGQPTARGESESIQVRDPASGKSVNLRVNYAVVCPVGNERKLVQSLGSSGDPENALRSLITTAARTYLWDNGGEVFQDTTRAKETVLEIIQEAIVEKTGLRFQGQIRLEHEEKLITVRFDREFEVRFKDTPEELGIRVQADLEIDPRKVLSAVVAIGETDRLEEKVKQATKQFFKDQVSSKDYIREISASLKENLQNCLDDALSNIGRRATGLNLRRGNADKVPPAEIEIPLKARAPQLGQSEPIQLSSKVLMTLEDFATYKDQNIASLEDWTQETFERVVQRRCFDCNYLDFLQETKWETLKSSIETEMREEVSSIGYKVVQIFSAPRLKEEEFMKSKTHFFKYEDLPLKSSSKVKVKLDVHPTFIINDWEHSNIVAKISQGVRLEDDIRRNLRNAIETTLITVTPNEYYLRFEQAEEHQDSVSSRLTEEITTTLQSEYGISASVTINPHDNDDVNKVRDLLNKPIKTEFTVVPLKGGEEVNLRVDVIVKGIASEGWGLVTRSDCNEAQIREAAATFLTSRFSLLESHRVSFQSEREVLELKSGFESQLSKHLADIFGIEVSLENYIRSQTAGEIALNDYDMKMLFQKIEASKKESNHQGLLDDKERENEAREQEDHERLRQDRFDVYRRLSVRKNEDGILTPDQEDELARLVDEFGQTAKNIRRVSERSTQGESITRDLLPASKSRAQAQQEQASGKLGSGDDRRGSAKAQGMSENDPNPEPVSKAQPGSQDDFDFETSKVIDHE